ncbi:probable protein phosphatase 2C 8 isoform X3 [Amborella trichopoda]|uniref:probable protein phosphatase 2C 8 isoform X3 n=1 Tax=Amborella trichopoda TaxID=13333 RepID=UPI0009C0F2F0|nr:probable protein phosphatase 2C 8 isoform X3 [Amborella trichopoda]|eukprot:XP_020529920.1 probable protein phosphatase 2C 8 isoform X3 [Amborella trichopoda]
MVFSSMSGENDFHCKREGDFNDANLSAKKSKHSGDLETENTETPVEFLQSIPSDGIRRNASNVILDNDAAIWPSISTGTCSQNPSDRKLDVSCDTIHTSESGTTIEDKAVCDSASSRGQLSFIEADAAEDKGSRTTMEDAWVILPDAFIGVTGKLRCSFYAIFDGHGGRLAAEYARNHLHANVLSAGLPRELMDLKVAKKAILEGITLHLKTDESLLKESATGGWHDGATAVCVWILGQTVLIANIGDAKAVLARSTGDGYLDSSDERSLKAIVVSREHKAIYPEERARIQKAGGVIGSNGRLQGRLEVSRAFGDRQFKKVGVTAVPDIHSFNITKREHFIILGCDGLWGVFGSGDAVEFVGKLLKEGLSASIVSRRLVREAIRERRCKDNCTAIVIVFRQK